MRAAPAAVDKVLPSDCPAFQELLQRSNVVLVYGEAAAGKTTLALTALKQLCLTRCLYVSTERLDFLRRAQQLGLDLGRLEVYSALDAYDFIELVASPRLAAYDAVAVDSINAYAHETRESYVLTLLAAASLRSLAERLGVKVLETAQVRYHGEAGEEPAAGKALELWADTVIELRRVPGSAERLAEVKGGPVLRFRVTEEGLEWLKC